MNWANRGLVLILRLYKKIISPLLGQNCRFYPSCSDYALECFHTFSFHKALGKSVVRVLKCHPFHPGGYDPVCGDGKTHSLDK